MATKKNTFEIDDNKAFDENLKAFSTGLASIDAKLGPVLASHLNEIAQGKAAKSKVWDSLLAALEEKKP